MNKGSCLAQRAATTAGYFKLSAMLFFCATFTQLYRGRTETTAVKQGKKHTHMHFILMSSYVD